MNQQETIHFVDQVATAFPGLLELLEKSPGTIGVWAKTLAQVSLDEALRVLEGWIAGTLENPPVGFRRELFALDVRAVVLKTRDDELRRVTSQQKMEIGRKRGKNPTPAYDISRPFMEKVLELNKQVMNGTLSNHEWDAGVAKLLDEAFAN